MWRSLLKHRVKESAIIKERQGASGKDFIKGSECGEMNGDKFPEKKNQYIEREME